MRFAHTGHARRTQNKRRPTLEMLEGRQLMTLGAQMAGTVNTTTRGAQFNADNATNAGGTTVVVWTDTFSPTDHDIRAQRFNSSGGKLGPEIVVSFSNLDEDHAKVAIDGPGGFEVAWTQSLSGGDTNVVAQRFNSNGAPVGGVIPVAASSARESEPDVATDLDGDHFVVSYTSNAGNNPNIVANLYNSSGQLVNRVAVATSLAAETHSSVAMNQGGLFDVAWEQEDNTSDHDVYMDRYNAGGGFLGTTAISTTATYDQTPSVAIDNVGDAVVAWEQDGNITAVRVSPAGVRVARITIANTSNLEYGPSVALRTGGGGFVVSYESLTSTSAHAMVAEVSASNVVTTNDLGSGTSGAAVSIDAFGGYFVSYTGGTSDLDIHARRGTLFS